MKTITVLYFAAVRDLVGESEEQLTLEVRSVRELAEHLVDRYPALAGRLGAVRFAKNEAFATMEDALADGDVVALIPPVAGG